LGFTGDVPTIFTHGFAAAAIGRFYRGPIPRGFWLATVLCAMLPDADVIGFDLGVEYGDILGHRGVSHSFVFAAMTGAVLAAWFGRGYPTRVGLALFAHFSLATASHALLDALTNGGLGVALWAPFSAERFFFPWTPLEVSPIGGNGLFIRDARGSFRWIVVILSELLWVWIPCALLMLAAKWMRRPHAASDVEAGRRP
jgi:inner membrane protein